MSNSCPQSSFKEGKKQQLPANSAQLPQESTWKSTHGKLPETLEDEGHKIIPDAMPCQLDSILTTQLGVGDMQSVSQILLTSLEQERAPEGWSHSSAKKVGKDRNKLASP